MESSNSTSAKDSSPSDPRDVILNWLQQSSDFSSAVQQTEALWALTNLAGFVPPESSWENTTTTTTASAIPNINNSSSLSSNTNRNNDTLWNNFLFEQSPASSLDSATLAAAVQLCATIPDTTANYCSVWPNKDVSFLNSQLKQQQQQQQLQSFASSAIHHSHHPDKKLLTNTAVATISNNSNTINNTNTNAFFTNHANAIPTLISLLKSPHGQVQEQAMWILGSLVVGNTNSNANTFPEDRNSSNKLLKSDSSSAAAREAVLTAGILEPLCTCLKENISNITIQRIGSWLLSNLVVPTNTSSTTSAAADNMNTTTTIAMNTTTASHKKEEEPIIKTSTSSTSSSGGASNNGSSSLLDISIVLPALQRLLWSHDADVLSHTCWALSHLCDGPSIYISAVVVSTTTTTTLPQRLVELLLHPSWRVTKPALRTIGNIVCAECTSTMDFTEIMIQGGAVPKLKTLVTHSNREIQKEACWTLSNIAAGTISQIQSVMDSGAIPLLIALASDVTVDHEVRSEACWVVLNATSCGSDAQVQKLAEDGCVHVLGLLLKEASMVMMALEGLERVLQVEEASASTTTSSVHVGSVVNASLMESLEQHKNSAVSKRATRIWKQHFVCCALCRQYFSRHCPSEARFCNECKCHVCSSCKCEIYHLSYQEELWKTHTDVSSSNNAGSSTALGIHTNASNNKKSKKKKQKKKEKKKQTATKRDETNNNSNNNNNNKEDLESAASKSAMTNQNSNSKVLSSVDNPSCSSNNIRHKGKAKNTTTSNNNNNEEDEEDDSIQHSSNSTVSCSEGSENGSVVLGILDADQTNLTKKKRAMSFDNMKAEGSDDSIDFVLYLQQTGSIIALSKLMDALDFD